VLDYPRASLQALRLLDPMLDAYILPSGRVWVLYYEPGKPRVVEAQKLLIAMKDDGDQADPAYAVSLQAAGFWLVADMPYLEGISAGAVTQRARQVLNVTRDQLNKTMAARRAQADNTDARVKMREVLSERIRSSARFDWKRAWRGRKLFSN
jgi:hypothetical protein